jgi:hypothetical protein
MTQPLTRSPAQWPVFGLPELIVSDNSRAFDPNRIRADRMFPDLAQGPIGDLAAKEAPQAHLFCVMLRAIAAGKGPPGPRPESLLDRFARKAPRRVLVDSLDPVIAELGGTPEWTSQRLCTWAFSDGSLIVRITSRGGFAPLQPNGLGNRAMLDTVSALRAALETGRHDLVLAYVQAHGRLPRLRRELIVRALESTEEEVRLAGMWSLSPSRGGA